MAAKATAAKRAASSPTDVPLHWVNVPLQDRSKRTLERLLDATEEIIRTRGVDAVTIPNVARAAESSVGSFYARFPDKTALLQTLHARACDQSVATAAAALDPSRWQGVPASEIVRAFVRFAVMLFSERRPMMLAFSSALGNDPSFAQRKAETAASIGLLLRELFLQQADAIGHPDPGLALDMGLRIVTATLEQRNALDAGGKREVSVADDVLAQELTRAVARYLDIRDAAPATTPPPSSLSPKRRASPANRR